MKPNSGLRAVLLEIGLHVLADARDLYPQTHMNLSVPLRFDAGQVCQPLRDLIGCLRRVSRLRVGGFLRLRSGQVLGLNVDVVPSRPSCGKALAKQ